jgi:hypothetical protein
MASLQVHSVKAYTCQVFVPLAARIASHTDTAQKHTILDITRPPCPNVSWGSPSSLMLRPWLCSRSAWAPVSTDKKFERHFRVPPPVLSTGFNVWIPPRVGSDAFPSALAAASERWPARSGSRDQTERTHLYH